MESVPAFASVVFMITAFATVGLFLFAVRSSPDGFWGRMVTFLVPFWMLVQFVLTSYGFYLNTDTQPPRLFLLGVGPPLLAIALLFLVARESFISNLSLPLLTLVHVVRIPVELVLYWLAEAGAVPDSMTFHGTNFDILSGITAPLAFAATFVKGARMRMALIVWNFAALGLLFIIVITATLSLPSPIQQLAFDQPNIAVLNFPYIWLPSVIVPIVLFAHLASLYKLFTHRN